VDTALLVKALSGFFAIMNPFVALPMFLSLTQGYDASRQRRTALRVAGYSLVLCAVIVATGTAVLSFFGVGVNQFRIAGGIVVMTIALGMLNGSGSSAHSGTPAEQQHQVAHAQQADVAFYPMAFPMVVGPGTITTIIIFTGQAGGVSGYAAVCLALGLVLLAMLAVLWFASDIGHHMSMTLRVIMTRLMGMILAAIAVEMVLAGLIAVLPSLAR
jgi:multiple antibiotic resistance protein